MAEDKSSVRLNCSFCKICDGTNEPKTEFLFSSDDLVVFRDIKPAAKHHYLIVSREHIKDAKSLTKEQIPLLERMIETAKNVMADNGADPNDVRLGFHWPPFHTVGHLHLHAISPTSDMGFLSKVIFFRNPFYFVSPYDVLALLRRN